MLNSQTLLGFAFLALAFTIPNFDVESTTELCEDEVVVVDAKPLKSEPKKRRTFQGELRAITRINSTDSADEKVVKKYILQFGSTAKGEELKYGIPSSITLSQGILESNAGRSTLAKRGKNHFGIKCFSESCPPGHCTNHSDDHHKDFFRNFKTNWESYRAHSHVLRRPRYAKCYESKNSKDWCQCLSDNGYATSKTYAKDLMRVVDKYKLDKLNGLPL